MLADGFLAERLAPLQARHPELDIELIATSRNLSLARREAEIALRLARPASGELLARRVMTLEYGFYAAPEYLRRLDSGEQPVFIAFDDASDYVPEAAWSQQFLRPARVCCAPTASCRRRWRRAPAAAWRCCPRWWRAHSADSTPSPSTKRHRRVSCGC